MFMFLTEGILTMSDGRPLKILIILQLNEYIRTSYRHMPRPILFLRYRTRAVLKTTPQAYRVVIANLQLCHALSHKRNICNLSNGVIFQWPWM